MKFFISRFTIHMCTLALTAIACAFLIKALYDNDTFWSLFYGAIYGIIPAIAAINMLGELAFSVCAKGEEKDSIFKIMAIRTIKFLCYLILILCIALLYNDNTERLFLGVLIVALFFVYAVVEFTYFKNKGNS